MKKITAVFLIILIVCCSLTACKTAEKELTTQEVSDSTSETETTTMRTTENLSTTFKEAETNKIYPALNKDANGEYPYEAASYTTYYQSSNTTRTTNIHNAVDKLDGLKIPAGEVFSFNQTVGKRTVLAGYEEAKVVEGDEFVDGLGGGICQVSSTVFQAVLRANLEIKIRACHSLKISYVPLGGDATVQWNSQDFQFVNNSPADIRLSVIANNGTLTCTIYATQDIKPKDLKVDIKKDGKRYKLTRTVDGEVNYTTYSKYAEPKTTTTKKDKDKEKDKEKDKTTKKDSEKETTEKENEE